MKFDKPAQGTCHEVAPGATANVRLPMSLPIWVTFAKTSEAKPPSPSRLKPALTSLLLGKR